MSRWMAVLLLALGPALAAAQEQITWRNFKALQELLDSPSDKPVLYWYFSDLDMAEKLTKTLLADKRVVELSTEFTCVKLPSGKGTKSPFADKFSFIDPKKVDRSKPIDLMKDPQSYNKGFRLLLDATLVQVTADTSTTVQQMISTMQAVLKTLGKKPASDGKGKEKEKGKDGEKKKDEPAGKDEGKKEEKKKEEEKPAGPSPADQARTIVERGQAQEKAGKLFAALKLYQIASKIKGAAETAEEATGHVRRLTTNPESAKIIAAQKAEEDATRHLSVGKSYLSNKKHVTAAGYFKKALALLPASSPLTEEAKRLLAECEGKTDEG